ncbi:hypothetical protein M407DRAFT_19455 [Tulasnella calospora MUT 4182]|uniref:NmrA-like domain-containing protein n=1 Tax=Tulasnella calospora MUT 4182 TaxID=1051891 RepID=A0A0C3MCM3_9AGAM|nr:hypothetical protein M407DRAFT_19455 [Tulasnella calospora MUT 4182]
MTSAKPLVAVCGATGAQGGSVARFLLQEGSFRVRALTRQPESAKALALSRQGADIVRADFNEPESLLSAFRGAYAVFCMTNFFDPSAELGKKQVQQGKNIIDAAKACNIKHFVCSTAEHTGELNVPHWETQAWINDYLLESRIPRTSYPLHHDLLREHVGVIPIAEGMASAAPENLESWTDRSRSSDQVSPTEIKFSWAFPTDSTFPVYSSADTGGYVLNILKRPQEFIGRDVKIASEFISPRDWVSTMNEVLSTRNTFVRVTLDEIDMKAFEAMRGTVWPEAWLNSSKSAQDLVSNSPFSHPISPPEMLISNGAPPFRDPAYSRRVFPQLKTLWEIVDENWEKILAAAR